MKKRLLISLVACLYLVGMAAVVNATSLVWTGAELETAATWSSNASHSVSGSSVLMEANTAPNTAYINLFNIQVATGGSLDSTDTFGVSADLTRSSSDSDFSLGFTDGTNYIAFMMADNVGGNLQLFRYVDSDNDGILELVPYDSSDPYFGDYGNTLWQMIDGSVDSGLAMPTSGDYYGSMDVSSTGTSIYTDATFGPDSLEYTWMQFGLDLTQDIYLFGLANQDRTHENYCINSITYTDTIPDTTPGPDPVPEPSTILLLGSGLAGLVFYRRKKK